MSNLTSRTRPAAQTAPQATNIDQRLLAGPCIGALPSRVARVEDSAHLFFESGKLGVDGRIDLFRLSAHDLKVRRVVLF